MNNNFGITNIKVKHISCKSDEIDTINDFLKKHDGNIIDIQYQQNNFAVVQVLIIYQDNKKAGKIK